MPNTFLIITSIADQDHLVLKQYADQCSKRDIPFICVGDTKSPLEFKLSGCDFYSISRQQNLDFELAKILPQKHYARKNIGYLVAFQSNPKIIIETDDDNLPLPSFWRQRSRHVKAHLLKNKSWVNVYRYFTEANIWPRGFALEKLQASSPELDNIQSVYCPIQQGLADQNPDVDAIYRLILPLPIEFKNRTAIALGENTICPFNSQNTVWFKEAFPLLYLPYYCSFRMTDIWRSFIAQRIAWTCGWNILFHSSTVWQERNEHNLMLDFQDEIVGYVNNLNIMHHLQHLDLKQGVESIPENMHSCYRELIRLGWIGKKEIELLTAWLNDIQTLSL